MFATIKLVHIATVITTGTLFLLRGYWMLTGNALLRHPVVKVAPHVNDTILFCSALTLAWMIGQYPFVNNWLTAKFLALILYIVLGHIALRRGRTRSERLLAFVLALLTLAYIISVAACHNAMTCLMS